MRRELVDQLEDRSAGDWARRVVGTGPKRWVFFGAIALAIFSAPDLPARPSLALSAIATLAAAAWCLTNFWHCQEAHCIVTGPGWGLLGVFELFELALGRSLLGGAEQVPFLAVIAVAVLFEVYWRTRHGTNAVRRHLTSTAGTGGAKFPGS